MLRAPAALDRRPWSSAAARDRGKRGWVAPETDSQPQPGQGRSRVTWPRRPSANGRRRPRAGVPEARWRAIGRGGVPVGLSGAQTHLDSGRGVVERGLRGGGGSGCWPAGQACRQRLMARGGEVHHGDATARRGGTGGASTVCENRAARRRDTSGDRRRRRCTVVDAAVQRQRWLAVA